MLVFIPSQTECALKDGGEPRTEGKLYFPKWTFYFWLYPPLLINFARWFEPLLIWKSAAKYNECNYFESRRASNHTWQNYDRADSHQKASFASKCPKKGDGKKWTNRNVLETALPITETEFQKIFSIQSAPQNPPWEPRGTHLDPEFCTVYFV